MISAYIGIKIFVFDLLGLFKIIYKKRMKV